MKPISKLIIRSIEETLNENNFNFNKQIDNMGHMIEIELRKKGKSFTFNDHLNALIFSLLSNQRPWKPIQKNEKIITEIFSNFDKNSILNTDPNIFIERLRVIKCGNRAIKKQMGSLNHNIHILEQISNDFGSLDAFIVSRSPHNIAMELAQGDHYKLKQVGYALALEYLRNVGIDAVKPDTHIIRILSKGRLAYSESTPSPEEAVKILEDISKETGLSLSYLDALLWYFCATEYGNICTSTPRCNVCKLEVYCNGVH
ncbi:hypothetical protein LGL08_00145 [Clostridium estertheticum]|uniref:hypothetical protein n=1 Tax=Clostridium estertheticum TaxID=238834 RepID=UPI001CF55939|nr:hypothetical protein [Clostridium estertheticum]MCB2305624.1 hypothetical protein [Clostridium estertheticum]MCB2344560.1 hypothetical protein [Clostridium estertheticum]MCB2347980.1 hypothetical protein [Clostridium estertheticum]WAG45624.1 hypothetical protein LL127_19225 [Clostridium estertheticum]